MSFLVSFKEFTQVNLLSTVLAYFHYADFEQQYQVCQDSSRSYLIELDLPSSPYDCSKVLQDWHNADMSSIIPFYFSLAKRSVASGIISFSVPQNLTTISLLFTVEHTASGLIIHESNEYMFTLVHPSDFGLSRPEVTTIVTSNPSIPIDYIEIGTSNYDTVVHAAQLLMTNENIETQGVAVEAVIQHLKVLPQIPGLTKVVYFLPESIIDKLVEPDVRRDLKSCTTVNEVHIIIISSMLVHGISPRAVQKIFLPALTIADILQQHVQPGQSLRLLKTDMEGMDQDVVNQMIDFYENRTGSINITPEYPCVVFFETHSYKYQIILNNMGEPSGQDNVVVNCLCSSEDIRIALLLLHPNVVDFDLDINNCLTNVIF